MTDCPENFLLWGGTWFERDFMTEAFKAFDVITGQALGFQSIEEVAA